MLEIYVIFFTLILILLFNYISEKKQFLIDKKFNIHKSFATKNIVPITGGLTLLILSLFYLKFENQYIKFLLIFVLLVGLLSDINYLFSPLKRLFLQILIVLLFINYDQIFINSIRVQMFDNLLSNIISFKKGFFLNRSI